MFEIGLKIQKWWSNIKLRKSREIATQQVHETKISLLIISLGLKLFGLALFSLIILFPFFFMIMVSLMPREQADALKTTFTLIPQEWTWSNFAVAATTASSSTKYFDAFFLTFTNVLFSVVVKTFVTMIAGYAFSLKKWKFKNVLWSLFMALLVLPEVALLSGQYRVIILLDEVTHIRNYFTGIISVIALPFIASIFTALMYRNAFSAIPNRLKEVATVDGAVGARYFFKIAVPMVSPTTLTVVILTALASWNSFLWPSLVANGDLKVLSLWLFDVGSVLQEDGQVITLRSIKLAGAILSIAPMFGFYLLFRKRIMASISRQGSTIKG
ncbi:carbohydrate ABC transporter permease [Mycoplasma sp. 744]|uniref:carbohydrate ABC transporter permease n=1 Tax=unclassified Mycoplasma TaxID=2683645 RepID=UPI00211C4A3A|nr:MULTISPECIES: carbohydrate ABC transporter permease [unclassified Mycoplasma]MEA4115365.1 carbohydrate ABC transporter permease [Mycoplasma sp. 744]UUM19369.1 carbohydrate ABC transporter permease [Mycoplasma sp. 1018B]